MLYFFRIEHACLRIDGLPDQQGMTLVQVVCGINFKMFFDNDNGMYMYKNCREVEVLNDDDVALNASEQMLVHVTCWRGLGSPAVLNMDQALRL